jgi:hypothetical protein
MNKWTLIAAAVALIIALVVYVMRSAADDLEQGDY